MLQKSVVLGKFSPFALLWCVLGLFWCVVGLFCTVLVRFGAVCTILEFKMKFLCGLTMVLSFVATFPLVVLGLSWADGGQGLHPVLAGILVLVVLAVGYCAAIVIDSIEGR